MHTKPVLLRTLATIPLLAGSLALATPAAHAEAAVHATAGLWKVESRTNPDGPGKAIDVLHDGKPVVRLIHGDGQMKPFLHVFGTDGDLLTNPGLDAAGEPAGRFPHHRGIFIGWNRIQSDLGNDDLWHFTKGEWMDVTAIRHVKATDDAAEIAIDVAWRSPAKDDDGSNILINETRTMRVTKPDGGATVIDATFHLTAARKLTLGGDLQHAGVHFRAHNEVADRAAETLYLWSPDVENRNGRIINPEMRWCRLVFPRGDRWYSAIQMNAPGNPTEELSWRDYGRFGFFFSQALDKDESITLNHRFVVSPIVAPENAAFPEAVATRIREHSEDAHREYAASF